MKNFSAPDAPPAQDGRRDHLGTPRAVVDRSRNKVIWRWNIMGEVFGADAPQEDPDKDGQSYVLDMRFPGQRHDRYAGLFQNGFRDYDPASGRYVQSDPIGLNGGNATYAYVGNSPLMRVDPRGLRWLSDSDSSLGFLESTFASDAIFIMNYRDMRKANTIDADKFTAKQIVSRQS